MFKHKTYSVQVPLYPAAPLRSPSSFYCSYSLWSLSNSSKL